METMETIELTKEKIIESAGHSSKGNQPKWFMGGKWYKADHMGYEALSEILVSALLEKSNVDNFVKYYPVDINFEGRTLNGCYSYNFLEKGCELIPLERLHRAFYGIGLHSKLAEIGRVKEKIQYTTSFVEECTDLKDFGKYLAAMIEIDAFFLNEDRHTNNIALIRNPTTNQYKLCPYFDQGLSLLSDTEEFWLDGDLEKHMLRVTAKPFGSFEKQTQAVRDLYGETLQFHFTMDDVDKLLSTFQGRYSEKIIHRVGAIIRKQYERNKSKLF